MGWFNVKTTELEEILELILSRYGSEHTARQYRALLNDLCQFSGLKKGHLDKLERAQAMSYLRHCQERKGQRGRKVGQSERVCEATVRRKHIILKNIFMELVENGLLLKNPFDFPIVNAPTKPQKRPTKPLPFESVMAICNAPDEETAKGIRDRAILATLFGNGGRRGELSQLRLGNVETLPGGAVRYEVLRTKTRDSKTKLLPAWAGERLGTHIEQRKQDGAVKEDHVFVGLHGNPISGTIVYRIFKKYVSLSGLDPSHFSPHSARATMATYLEANGASIKEIMEVGGWSSSNSAERYIKRQFNSTNHPALNINFDTKA